MNRFKFRAILRDEAKTNKLYKEKGKKVVRLVYFTLDDLMRGKVVFAYPEHWIFDRSTGIRDLYEKEIYENDILKDDQVLTVVEWDAGFGRYFSIPGTQRSWANCTVVGNKHENEDLLIKK